MRKALRSLLVCCAAFLWSIVPSPPVSARGGGGCLEKGTPVLTPSGVIPIEQLKPGDVVLGLAGGAVRSAAIRDILQVRADEIIEIDAGGPVLRATAKHPVGVAPGVFRTASVLRRGDAVMLVIDGKPAIRTVAAVRRHRTGTDAYNILVAEGGTYLADGIVVHNKGCFLPDTRIRREDGTELPISRVRPGDRLLAFTGDGTVVPATVRNVLTHTVEEYLLVRTGQMLLRVTPEHPFYVGNGTFRTLEALRPGDTIHAYDGAGWSEQRITSIESLRTPTTVYNLQTDAPHTFFANGIAVHNKGGGCFPAGTKVRTPAGRTPIEALAAGDLVTAIDERGRPVSARIEEVHATTSRLLTVHTKRGALMTTNEHPLLSTSGDFVHAAMLTPGETVARSRGGRLRPAQVTGLEQGAGPVVVYNLTVDGPHTFVADGFVVHNKGGGGGGSRGGGSRGGGGYRGGGRSSGGGSGRPMTPEQTKWFLIIVGGTLAVVFIIAARGKWRKRSSNLDQIFSRREIEQKGGRTLKLVRFIAQQDPSFSEEKLAGQVRSTFLLLQKCWQAREYGPMRPLMMADLFRDHLRQIEGMKRNHEINMIDGLQVDAIDLVNVRYPLNKDEREFTALITASATDYYLDDRTHERLRGDDAPAPFQEFWTFQ